ncbi:unnamed protein product [Pleuronectes platessa]|uniref:Uncharacterized protein n=1 Tax=Pleuronectes platessa TaxID=8262 RepID=A0A9N7YWV7_PLEPL|nr:unnamed protein product [Pleuronectes platessa]
MELSGRVVESGPGFYGVDDGEEASHTPCHRHHLQDRNRTGEGDKDNTTNNRITTRIRRSCTHPEVQQRDSLDFREIRAPHASNTAKVTAAVFPTARTRIHGRMEPQITAV